MYRIITWALSIAAWGVCLRWALLLQYLPNSAFGAHGVCGPWGCGPPVPVLLACHAFWLVLLGPPAVLAAYQMPVRVVRRLGHLLVALAVLGLVALAGWEAATWYPQASAWERHYLVQRYIFALITLVDIPILEVLVLGSGLRLAEAVRSRRESSLPTGIADEPARCAAGREPATDSAGDEPSAV